MGLIIRDLKLAVRSGGGFGLAIAFFLIFTVLAPLSLGADQSQYAALAPGLLWLAALLSCLLTLDRIFVPDYEDGTLDILATSPMPLGAVFLTKALAHWATTGLPLALLAPVFGVLLNLPPVAMGTLVVTLLLGTPALSVLGALGGALTLGVRRGGLLLSLLVLPLYIPTLIFGARAASQAAMGLPVGSPVALLAGISLFAIAVLPMAGAAVLRMNLR